ncbi:peptidoglycan-recognition protein LC-like [Diorhabda sublineata]|uniref:peptidoglycan-recognition protein LC-like n=1 Tax=Diorhabda sublineata TaxID=1163346 RepID=UPI0024E13F69|nr:peptidoglycan-recognition protein LC-like [Diorhabda sublineata]
MVGLEVMPYVISSKSNSNFQDGGLEVHNKQINQVECVSLSTTEESFREEDESDDEYDNAVVVKDELNVPNFGSVNVVNSNDVHFGNKTVYKGPVTIKQFVYPKSDLNNDVIGLNGILQTDCGVANEAFQNDREVSTSERKLQERVQENEITATSRLNKGAEWIKTFPKNTIFFMVLILVSITIISAILIWKYQVKSIPLDNRVNVVEEEDKDQPIDYQSDGYAALSKKVRIVSRLGWLAQPPSEPIDKLTTPVSLIIIQHTATESCSSQAQCVFQTRTIQTFHMESKSWSDIAYNFLIGGDGAVYEGRGWTKVGAHTYAYNSISLGIGFIGTFNAEVPNEKMINAFNNLADLGVRLGYLTNDYKILAARQLSGTESPGKAFYDVIKTWTHWTNKLS